MEVIKDRFKDFDEYKDFYNTQEMFEITDSEITLGGDKERIVYSKQFASKETTCTFDRLLFTNKVIGKKGSILDIGCHTGLFSLPYAYKGRRVVGIDINQKAIDFCNQKVKQFNIENTEYICSPYEEFKTDEKFDFVLVAEILEHVLEPEKLLDFAEKHCLKKVIVTTPNYYGRFGIKNEGDVSREHIRLYEEKELEEMLSKRGKIIDKEITDILMFTYK
jgi:ubiquinone/menaquinone biosynthesis C-methylase UbiE